MLKITRKTEYALLALGYLDRAGADTTTKVRQISDNYHIPFPVLSKVMQQLSRQGVIAPVQGAQGGYRLQQDLGEVNLWQFMEQLEGPLGLVDCVLDTDCNQLKGCIIQSPLQVINHTIRDAFVSMSVEDVVHAKHTSGPTEGIGHAR